jgi:hypothetical protein
MELGMLLWDTRRGAGSAVAQVAKPLAAKGLVTITDTRPKLILLTAAGVRWNLVSAPAEATDPLAPDLTPEMARRLKEVHTQGFKGDRGRWHPARQNTAGVEQPERREGPFNKKKRLPPPSLHPAWVAELVLELIVDGKVFPEIRKVLSAKGVTVSQHFVADISSGRRTVEGLLPLSLNPGEVWHDPPVRCPGCVDAEREKCLTDITPCRACKADKYKQWGPGRPFRG